MLKNNKVRKILSIVLIAVVVISFVLSVSTIVHAAGDELGDIDITAKKSKLTDNATNYAGYIFGAFQVVGYAIAVIMLAWLGIKYILASPDGKAEIKKQAFAYILGAVLLFAAGTIVGLVRDTIGKAEEETTTDGYVQVIDEQKVLL